MGKSLPFWRTESSGVGVRMALCMCVFVNVACEACMFRCIERERWAQVKEKGEIGSASWLLFNPGQVASAP